MDSLRANRDAALAVWPSTSPHCWSSGIKGQWLQTESILVPGKHAAALSEKLSILVLLTKPSEANSSSVNAPVSSGGSSLSADPQVAPAIFQKFSLELVAEGDDCSLASSLSWCPMLGSSDASQCFVGDSALSHVQQVGSFVQLVGIRKPHAWQDAVVDISNGVDYEKCQQTLASLVRSSEEAPDMSTVGSFWNVILDQEHRLPASQLSVSLRYALRDIRSHLCSLPEN